MQRAGILWIKDNILGRIMQEITMFHVWLYANIQLRTGVGMRPGDYCLDTFYLLTNAQYGLCMSLQTDVNNKRESSALSLRSVMLYSR